MYEENYRNFAAAVVGVACEEYCLALRRKEKYENQLSGLSNKDQIKKCESKINKQVKEIKDIEDFFGNEISIYLENPPSKTYLIKTLKKISADKNNKVIRFLKNNTSTKDFDL